MRLFFDILSGLVVLMMTYYLYLDGWFLFFAFMPLNPKEPDVQHKQRTDTARSSALDTTHVPAAHV